MCAALTVPIIKDGYRLYPGMPVSGQRVAGRNGASRSSSGHKPPKGRASQQNILIQGRLSPPDSVSTSGSPPRNGNVGARQVLLQPRTRTTSNQSQMSARSSFDMAPTTARTDLIRGRSAMSTSQLYMQQRRELAIQQQLRKQELARKQSQQAQQNRENQGKNRKSSSPAPLPPLAQRSDSNGNESSLTDYDAEDSLNFCDDQNHRSRKGSAAGDHNNNKDSSSTNPLRKLLKRLGLGNHHNGNHRSENNSFSETNIEQAVPALQSHLNKPEMGVVVTARQ